LTSGPAAAIISGIPELTPDLRHRALIGTYVPSRAEPPNDVICYLCRSFVEVRRASATAVEL
jgi:hypothetical protein